MLHKTTRRTRTGLVVLFATAMMSATVWAATELEVLHYWTSGGEAKAAAELKKIIESKGIRWKDFVVAGGGGENAMAALRARAMAGIAPAAAQIKGPTIQEWGEEGLLANINAAAKSGDWDDKLPKIVADIMKFKGKYVAAPVNVHRVNWLWINPSVFERAGATVPETWDEFFEAADKIRKAGFIPVAQGGQPWQEATLFEIIVLGVGGSALYQRAFVGLDEQALRSPEMIKAFDIMARMKGYIDPDAAGRDWNVATAMVINGQAAMQFMGDWAKGEFTSAGQVAGKDFNCVPAPGTKTAYLFNIDSITMFKVRDEDVKKAQLSLAQAIMSPAFQEIFNLNKGSIPVLPDVGMDKFDVCAKASMQDFTRSSQTGSLLPSMAHGMAVPTLVQSAIVDVVDQFMQGNMTSAQAVQLLVQASKL